MNERINDTSLFSEFFGCQPQPIVWLEPVWDSSGQSITDFVFSYSNKTGLEYFGFEEQQLRSLTISNSPALTDEMRGPLLEEMIKVYHTGESSESRLYNPVVNIHAVIFRVRFKSGVLTIIQDRTKEYNALEELRNKTKQLEQERNETESILNGSLNGVMVADAITDDAGNVIDFRIVKVNAAFEKLLLFTTEQVINGSFLELFPGAIKAGSFNSYRRVFTTGIAETFETFYKDEHLQGWYQVSCVKNGNGIVVTFTDITDLKSTAEEITRHKNLLQNILKNSSNGISVGEMVRNEKGDIRDIRTILANDAAVKFVGRPEEEYIGKLASELDSGFLQSEHFRQCIRCMETGEAFLAQYYLEPTKRWLEVSVSRMDENRQIYIFTDITTVKEATLRVERAAAELKTVFDFAQTGLFTLSPCYDQEKQIFDFRFIMANPTIAAYVGQEPSRLEGELCSKWYPGYLTNGCFDLYKTTYETGKVSRQEFHYATDGFDNYLDLQAVKIGEHLLVSFSDHTELRAIQKQLERSVDELRRSNKSLEEFAYAASHDLQEPLRKINFFSEKLRNELSGSLSEGNIKMIERMRAATTRMKNLIDDLLTYSRVSVRAEHDRVNLSDLLQTVLQDIDTSVQETGAKIQIDRMPVINGDAIQLRQLFQNLLSNAIKYRKKDIIPEVAVTARKTVKNDSVFSRLALPASGDYYVIEVKDNGIGFEQGDAERIFQVFQRLHGRSEYEGTGVGLAIVQKVVLNHSGYIFAESSPGEGSVFTLLLPVPQ